MTITITPNLPRDFRGLPVVNEGETVSWLVTSSNPALNEAVQIGPIPTGGFTTFPTDVQPQTVNFLAGGRRRRLSIFPP